MPERGCLHSNLRGLLKRRKELYDVSFFVGVGRSQIEVKGVKILLMAASPVFEEQFSRNLETQEQYLNTRLLPDLDPSSFQQFIKLTLTDRWNWNITSLHLDQSPARLLHLLALCQQYEMSRERRILQEPAKRFFQSFHVFKDKAEFLTLSRDHLQTVLASEELCMEENEILESACRWAENQCKVNGKPKSGENIRHFLGDCIYQIRFPLLNAVEWKRVTGRKDLLTAEETVQISKFKKLNHIEKLNFDATGLAFKTQNRAVQQTMVVPLPVDLSEGNVAAAESSRGVQAPRKPFKGKTLNLTTGSITTIPGFVCDSRSLQHNGLQTDHKIALHGLGFYGPVDTDSFYDISVEILHISGYPAFKETHFMGKVEQRVFATKGKIFYLTFDRSIIIHPIMNKAWGKYYKICFVLKGPNTCSVKRELRSISELEEGGVRFSLRWYSGQLAELQFKIMKQ